MQERADAFPAIFRVDNDAAARFLARRPEERLLDDVAVLQATVRRVTVALAYLSLTWSTVVLLVSSISSPLRPKLKDVTGWIPRPGRGRPTNPWLVGPRRTVL
jgi:hypothetical protein